MGEIVIVGAGIAGLGAALALGRQGHHVILCERDAAPVPASTEAMWSAWRRPGVVQAPLGHTFLPRLRMQLRERAPDILQRLLDAGVPPWDCTAEMPGEQRLPEDSELTGLLCRRIVLEGVLRQAVETEPTVELRAGCAVAGLLAEPSTLDSVPRVVGVRTQDGSEIAAQTVVLVGGRLLPVPDWLAAIGAPMPEEEVEHSGRLYYARHFRLRPRVGEDHLALASFVQIFELGYLLYGMCGCDARTFCLEFSVPAEDTALHVMHEEAAFMAAARSMTDAAPWLAPGRYDPIGPIAPMGQERNLLRRFVREGRPVALGLHILGDARCQTHNIYGFGTALAFSQAMVLADVLAAHPTDPLAQALALEEQVAGEVAGLYQYAVEHDRATRRKNRGEPEWEAGTGEGGEGWVETLVAPAATEDADIFRAYTRRWTLLDPPDVLARNAAVLERARELAAIRHPSPEQPPKRLGPTRDELLQILAEERVSPTVSASGMAL